jgi:uncharacterized protein (TIGR00299 family) protein
MRIAYLDCFSGISGDMLLGALIDAGAEKDTIISGLDLLDLSGFTLTFDPVKVHSLQAVRARVEAAGGQPHRNANEIQQILSHSRLPEPVRDKARAVFHRLAEAEARAHGCPVDEVHFHEVGAVDAVIDVVGTLLGMHALEVEKIVCSPLPMPHGWTDCEHGKLPIPAPAVCELLQGIPVFGENLDQELVTPTGAALAVELAGRFGPLPAIRMGKTGYGAGTMQRNDGRPNLLRLIIGDEFSPDEAQQVLVMETSLDDWSPETWPLVAEKLFDSGALDVILFPVHMKKGRPGFTLKVICDPAHSSGLQGVILSETSAIGLRFHTEQRVTLPREIITVPTPWGPVKAKKIETPAGIVITPEYEECRRLAQKHDVSIKSVYHIVSQHKTGH